VSFLRPAWPLCPSLTGDLPSFSRAGVYLGRRSLARSLTATQQPAETLEEEKNAVFSSGENAANVAEDPGCRFLLDASNNSTRDANDDFFFFFYPPHRDLSPMIAPAARSFGVVARTRRQQ